MCGITSCLFASAMVINSAQAATLIHAGKVIDGVSDEIQSNMTIVVDGNEIIKLSQGFIEPQQGDTVINMKQRTVMPGLMDMHTHFSYQSSPASYSEGFKLNPADYALRATVYAKKTLQAGFTTVRDLGDAHNITVALRNAIDQGWVSGPRIYTAAKSIATTGGHADQTNGYRANLAPDPGPKEGVINSAAEARKAVRQRYKDGADLIKITATGGVLSMAKSGQNPQFTTNELNGIMEAANDYGMTVAVHAHGKEGMKRAVQAGVSSIEHGTYMDDEVIALMKKHGTYYVPTISAGKFVAKKARIRGYFPDMVRPKAAKIGPLIQQTFTKAYRAGVNIAFGTDAGVFPHGENYKEFEYMVEGGMPAMVAIKSATIEAAKLLRIDDKLGTLESGKLADIIAVNGDPLENIKLMGSVTMVMKNGEVVLNTTNP
ncbi:metal-dependent hydrolase family protein [Flocculibacter collagenilyticus]|uniref:metal-dependent hydrolase family protein n=1 Tax=Flocculibacter collagenilyticus TaxID=2744479 RepID=UPI0018F704A5|nr:amidohydrolase family protein [Flocculibacter collagenilyticus]